MNKSKNKKHINRKHLREISVSLNLVSWYARCPRAMVPITTTAATPQAGRRVTALLNPSK